MSKIKRLSLVDQIYLQLREEIVTGRIPLGSRINVNEIQEDLGVSSTPLREALNRLQQDGLVTYENNVGASTLTLDAHDVEEIEELALTLQTAAVRFALERGDRDALVREIEAGLQAYAAARTDAQAVQAVFELIGAFDRSPNIVGTTQQGTLVRDASELRAFCMEHHPDVAVLTIPRESVHEIAGLLCDCGVKGIWNFTNVELHLEYSDVKVENVHLAESLMVLSCKLSEQER